MKILIGYVSMSGNTEDMANILKEELLAAGCEVEVESLETTQANRILDYDCSFIGAYTWGDGDLPYEAEDFFEELNHLNLTGVYSACFGSGDHDYPQFCAAVDTFATRLKERGSNVFPEMLKIELNPETEEQIAECQQFAQSVLTWVMAKKEMEHV